MSDRFSDVDSCVLIVDDAPNWRELVRSVLGNICRLELFSTFEEASQAIDVLDFDVAVLDVRLEDEDTFNVEGVALLRKIRIKNPCIGIVILTGYPESIRQEILDEFQPDAFFVKDETFDNIEFRKAIQSLLVRDNMK